MSPKSRCMLEVNDVIRCHNVFDNAWRDGDTEVQDGDRILISDGTVWVSHSKPPEDSKRTVSWEHRLSDEERVERFNETGMLGPETEIREGEVTVSRRVRGSYASDAIVVEEPVAVSEGVWRVAVAKLDPRAAIGEETVTFNFYLAARGADTDSLDERKIIHEERLLILPRKGRPLFGPWSTCQTKVRVPDVGNVMSGAELRWYMADVDREAEYIVTDTTDEEGEVTICLNSSRPRDCSDDWCGLRHSHGKQKVRAGVTVTARRVRIDPESGVFSLLDEEISWFRATDEAFSDSLRKKSIHVGGDRNRNFVFAVPETE